MVEVSRSGWGRPRGRGGRREKGRGGLIATMHPTSDCATAFLKYSCIAITALVICARSNLTQHGSAPHARSTPKTAYSSNFEQECRLAKMPIGKG